MEENNEKRTELRRNPLTIGVSRQENADRFMSLNRDRGETYEKTLVYLLDVNDSRGDSGDDTGLLQQIDKLKEENQRYKASLDGMDLTVKDLQEKLDIAVKDANANAESGTGIQLQLDELRQRTDGAIILKPNPVVRHFLDEMAAKTGQTPDKILERLYLDDLQNPRSNNLPYTVSSSEIREVMRKLQKEEEE